MQKIRFAIALILAYAGSLAAQNLFNTTTGFADSTATKIFGDKVNIRTAPSKDAPVLTQLTIGHDVLVISSDTATVPLNNWPGHWHLVSFQKDGKTQQGYVHSALLSFMPTTLGPNTVLYNVVKHKSTNDITVSTLEIRLLNEGRIVGTDTVNLFLGEYDEAYADTHDTLGLPEWPSAVNLHFGYPACGYVHHDIWLLWDGESQFTRLPLLSSAADGGVYAESEEYIFPKMAGGVEGRLLYAYYLSQGMEEDGFFDLSRKIRPMTWDNNKFRIMTEDEFYNNN